MQNQSVCMSRRDTIQTQLDYAEFSFKGVPTDYQCIYSASIVTGKAGAVLKALGVAAHRILKIDYIIFNSDFLSTCKHKIGHTFCMQFSAARPGPADSHKSAESEGTSVSGVIESAGPTNPMLPWFLRAWPERLLPYAYLMRLDKPIGEALLGPRRSCFLPR